jgi:hypothetical protein
MIEELLRDANVTISFSCENSQKVPGLQIIDLITGISKDYLIGSVMNDAFSIIEKSFIFTLEPKKI